MELERIKEGVAALNGLGVKVAMVKVAKDDTPETLAKKFMEAVGKIPEESETELEEKHKEKWDALCAVALEAKKFLVEGAKKSTPPVPPKKGRASNPSTEVAVKKEKAPKKDAAPKSKYDHRLDSSLGVIDVFLEKGGKKEALVKKLAEAFGKDEKWAKSRLYIHLNHLKEIHKLKVDDESLKVK